MLRWIDTALSLRQVQKLTKLWLRTTFPIKAKRIVMASNDTPDSERRNIVKDSRNFPTLSDDVQYSNSLKPVSWPRSPGGSIQDKTPLSSTALEKVLEKLPSSDLNQLWELIPRVKDKDLLVQTLINTIKLLTISFSVNNMDKNGVD